MKNFKNILSVITFLVLLTSLKSVFPQSVGIGSSTFTPKASSILEVLSTNKGILIPRIGLLGNNDIATIASPSNSLLIYNTATVSGANAVSPGYFYMDSVNSIWVRLFSGNANGWSTSGNAGTAVATNFLGTTDYVGLVFKTNNLERMRLQNDGQLTIGSTTAGGKLDVHQSSSNDVARFTTYGNSNDIRLRRTSGTQGAPVITSIAGTIIGRFIAEGYDGSGYTNVASINMEIDSTATGPTNMPGRIVFSTYKAATPTLPGAFAERMRINNNGNVGIGTNPVSKARLYVRTSGSIAGTGYGTSVSSGIYATSYGDAAYTFGITGIGNSNTQSRSGGVFGSIFSNTWGALGFVDSIGVKYGGYFTGLGANNAAYFNGKVIVTEQLTTTSIAAAISNKTANYTLTALDQTIIFKSVSVLTATLPAASGCSGRIYVIVNQGSASLSITPSFQNLLDVATFSLGSGTSITIQSNGTNWYQIR